MATPSSDRLLMAEAHCADGHKTHMKDLAVDSNTGFHLQPEDPRADIVNFRGRLHLNTITVSIVRRKQPKLIAAVLDCSVSGATASSTQLPMP